MLASFREATASARPLAADIRLRRWASLVDNRVVEGVRFVRRLDGLTQEFIHDGAVHGFPSYRRVDRDMWCRRLPDFGWVVCSDSAAILSRPFGDTEWGDRPPEGLRVSHKGDRSYVYDLVRFDLQAATGLESR